MNIKITVPDEETAERLNSFLDLSGEEQYDD